MYCIKCGQALPDNVSFCSACGHPQDLTPKNYNDSNNHSLLSLVITFFTSPLLFIIRMLGEDTKIITTVNWGAEMTTERTFLPNNIKAVMVVLLIISINLSIILMKASHEGFYGKNKVSTIMLIVNIILGLFITFAY